MKEKLCIGIAGASGSGKTTVTRSIEERFGTDRLTVLSQDNYYRNLDHLPFEKRAQINFDHPKSFDNELLSEHVQALLQDVPIESPTYCFKTHLRREETVTVLPTSVIVVEGILVLESALLRELMDIKLYVDTDADVAFIRRLTRDIAERGRTMAGVVEQYMDYVRPMFLQFVEPSKRHSDLIIPEGGHNEVALRMLCAKIEIFLERGRIVLGPEDGQR